MVTQDDCLTVVQLQRLCRACESSPHQLDTLVAIARDAYLRGGTDDLEATVNRLEATYCRPTGVAR